MKEKPRHRWKHRGRTSQEELTKGLSVKNIPYLVDKRLALVSSQALNCCSSSAVFRCRKRKLPTLTICVGGVQVQGWLYQAFLTNI